MRCRCHPTLICLKYMSPTLSIEVLFDLICPWCLIGKRHLENALSEFAASHPAVKVDILWRPFILLPDTPSTGLPYQPFYLQRLGSPEAVERRRAQVQEAGDSVGLQFDFDAISVLPNTLAAHRLVQYLGRQCGAHRQQALIEALYRAYFMQGRNISDIGWLAHLATTFDLPNDEAADYLNSPSETDREAFKRQSMQSANCYGISGVPGFTFNQRFPLSGAIPATTLLQAMQQAVTA